MKPALLTALFVTIACAAPAQDLALLTSGQRTSLRGLSVVNDSVAWVSGSNGWIARTTDRGKTWQWQQPEAYKTFDFRDIEAFSDQSAIVINAGSPAVILKTTDGGRSWKEVYRNASPDIFLDGMDFWDERRGLIFGDPIRNKLQLLATTDGGATWNPISENLRAPLDSGEASFAASGTTIRTLKGGRAWIATGGKRSRLFATENYGRSWKVYVCPITQGEASKGPFSIAFRDKKYGVAAGGDYRKDTVRENNLLITRDGGASWQKPDVRPFGYRSAVEFISARTLVATGTSGTDISRDAGITWERLSPESFNSVRKAKAGNWVVLAGGGGKIASLNQR